MLDVQVWLEVKHSLIFKGDPHIPLAFLTQGLPPAALSNPMLPHHRDFCAIPVLGKVCVLEEVAILLLPLCLQVWRAISVGKLLGKARGLWKL